MSKGKEIEYCRVCDEVYAKYPTIWLCFESPEGETRHAHETHYTCPRCYSVIERSKYFIESLMKRDSVEYITAVLDEIIDLTPSAKKTLFFLMRNFTVPSFATFIKCDINEDFQELRKKRHIELSNTTSSRNFATLNAHKLQLFDDHELLEMLTHQGGFMRNPEYIEDTKRVYSDRRKKRVDSLVNNFTESEKGHLLDRFGGRCALTGKEVPLQLDHVLPVSIGHGGTTLPNMLPIWQRINSSKGAKNLFEWYEEFGDAYEVCPERFEKAIEYLAELNEMTTQEYRDYVYECHANPDDILTEAIT